MRSHAKTAEAPLPRERDTLPEIDANRVRFEDIFAMLDDISEHTMKTGVVILNADVPNERPCSIGFVAASDDHYKHWTIAMPQVVGSFARARESGDEALIHKADVVSQCLKSKHGRLKLAMAFPGQKKPITPPGAPLAAAE